MPTTLKSLTAENRSPSGSSGPDEENNVLKLLNSTLQNISVAPPIPQ